MPNDPVTDPSQLRLFDVPAKEAPDAADAALEAEYASARAIAHRLPDGVYFGTSSWSFPGWRGLVYGRGGTTGVLSRDGLAEYARHPLLRTVGIDRSYYAPIPDADLQRYAGQLPDGFRCCIKAPAAVTSDDPAFLSVERFVLDLLEPCARFFLAHTGPIILQFAPDASRAAGSPARFAELLDRFLEPLPRDFEYAIELRDRTLLTDAYRKVLARHGAAHVYNYWSRMPPPGAQAEWLEPEGQPFSVIRLLMPPGTAYESQRERFRPFDRIVEPDDRMREQVAAIARRVVNRGRRVFVLVNNKAEGSAPLTVRAIAERLAFGR